MLHFSKKLEQKYFILIHSDKNKKKCEQNRAVLTATAVATICDALLLPVDLTVPTATKSKF
jgi:hypothetical protein